MVSKIGVVRAITQSIICAGGDEVRNSIAWMRCIHSRKLLFITKGKSSEPARGVTCYWFGAESITTLTKTDYVIIVQCSALTHTIHVRHEAFRGL
jgi:hypothetical protein